MTPSQVRSCPKCGTGNTLEASRCVVCQSPIGEIDSQPSAPRSDATQSFAGRLAPELPGPGSILAGRYRLLKQLGSGGMGAVFKAVDLDTEEDIAIKLIKPELTFSDSSLTRLKRELRMTHAITHPNVVRTYDLISHGALKFISMAFVDGQSLAEMNSGPELPISRVMEIICQICDGLEAAHDRGVVHRDLKPQNIMVEPGGRVLVMDFGIAHCEALPDVTLQGTFVGTPDYCSPEQVRGIEVDGRSDIFSLGIIFYQLLTGALPYPRASNPAAMSERCLGRPKPPSTINPRVPKNLDSIVLKCLESDRERRYNTVSELKSDLVAIAGRNKPAFVKSKKQQKFRPLIMAAGAVALACITIVALHYYRQPRSAFVAPNAPVRVLLADLNNETGDPLFDGALEPLVTIALEESHNLFCFDRAMTHKLAAAVRPGSRKLDASTARLAAIREGLDVVIDGSISREGMVYRLKLEAINAGSGRALASAGAAALDRQGVLTQIDGMVKKLRRALGEQDITKTQFGRETFTATSLESAHLYASAQENQLAGRYEDALRQYLAAVKPDPNLGRAWAGAATVNHNLGNRDEAQRLFRIALSHMDRMTDREKFRTRGGYYIASGDYSHAIEEYSQLVREFPFDNAGHANLALAYFYKLDLNNALNEGRKAVEIYPDNVAQRNNVAWYALYAGDFPEAERNAKEALRLNGKFEKGWVALALAHFAQGRREEAIADWASLATVSARGRSLAALGTGDLAVMEARPEDVLAVLGSAADEDMSLRRAVDAGVKHTVIAEALLLEGKTAQAEAEADRALGISRDPLVEFPAARVFIASENWEKTRRIVQELRANRARDAQLQARLIEGELQLKRGNRAEAIGLFEEAKASGDTWLGRLDLAKAYIAEGEFAQADSELDIGKRRRGEALAVFLDDRPTVRYLAPLYYYAARAQDGLNSPAAPDTYRLFLDMRRGRADPLVRDAEKRLRSLGRQ